MFNVLCISLLFNKSVVVAVVNNITFWKENADFIQSTIKKHLSTKKYQRWKHQYKLSISLDCAVIKVFRYSFWQTILMFFNHLKSDFLLVQCSIATKFSPVIDLLKFVKMQFLIKSISL